MNLIPVSEVQTMAAAVAKSGLFGMKTPEQAMALMLVAQAEGLHPALAARDYDIIQGKPAKKAEAMLRSFLEAGGRVEWHALSDTIADATFSHQAGGTVRISWDMDRAKAAGLGTKDNWKKFPRQMLRSRVVSEGVRTVCPMATSGMYVPEEVQDFDEPKRAAKAKDMGEAERIDTPKQPEVWQPNQAQQSVIDLMLNAESVAALEGMAPAIKNVCNGDGKATLAMREKYREMLATLKAHEAHEAQPIEGEAAHV